jgi:hypothetical protein
VIDIETGAQNPKSENQKAEIEKDLTCFGV